MPAQPTGDPPPRSGALPPGATGRLGAEPFGWYVHVPFCAARCGYCDFNTYAPGELDERGGPARYLAAVRRELDLAAAVLGGRPPPAESVFLGGGTPTLLPPGELGALLADLRRVGGLAADAEVTVEANPESVDAGSLAALAAAGVTRLSLGWQSVRPHVLAALDRRHTPGRAAAAVGWARRAGLRSVSVDLIYGAAGESPADWRASVAAAVDSGADHVSAYALVVEAGTALARRVGRGELAAPADDDLAEKYQAAEEILAAAGLAWYELSNWARPGHECRHNLGYWRGGDWWGLGPGAHSHVGGVRWWNVRHPARYADLLDGGVSPAAGRETLTADQRRLERLLLGVRLAEGLPAAEGDPAVVAGLRADGLLAGRTDRLVLSLRGRLLADRVTLALAG